MPVNPTEPTYPLLAAIGTRSRLVPREYRPTLQASVGSGADVTLHDFLALPCVQRASPRVLSSESRLDRTIRWVHVAEAPISGSPFHGGELVMVEGRSIGQSRREEERLVAGLVDANASGLVIGLGNRFCSGLTPLVATARRRDLPVIAFEQPSSFVVVAEQANREILNADMAVVRFTESLEQELTELLLTGGDLVDVLAGLADRLDTPIVLQATDGEIVAMADASGAGVSGRDAWASYERGEIPASSVVIGGLALSGAEERARILAVGVDTARLPFVRAAVERVGRMIALEMARGALPSAEKRQRQQLLAAFVDGLLGPEEVSDQAEAHGFGPEVESLLPVVVVPVQSKDASAVEIDPAKWDLIWAGVRASCGQTNPVMVSLHGFGGRFLAVIGLPAGSDREEAAKCFAAAVSERIGRLMPSVRAAICVGPSAPGWVALREALASAAAGFHPGLVAADQAWYDATRPSLDGLLWSLRSRPELFAFCEGTLGRLKVYDREHKVPLTPTLEALCRRGGRKTEAARDLFIERQTMYKRLARIEEIIDGDLSDPELLCAIEIALKIHRMNGARQPVPAREGAHGKRVDDPRWEPRPEPGYLSPAFSI
ncbi:MAG: PucR family transcriptional regulator [Actinobacteria bacterium]|nr:PucR family transcriptional regulator [Actinomycetota bacterium]